MTTVFPGAIDSFTNPVAGDALNSGSVPHASQHANANDSIRAIEQKLGSGSSTPVVAQGLIGTGTGLSSWDRMSRRNLLINGLMRVAQRLPSALGAVAGIACVDATYQSFDRWKTLQNTGTVWSVFNHTASPSPGVGRTMLFVSGGNSSKGGTIQILEAADSWQLRSQVVSLQAMMFASAGISDVRMAVVSWAGTADAPTHPVSTWNASGTNPTLATSWTYVSTPINLSLGAAYANQKLQALTVPAGCNNLGVVFWCEDLTQTNGTDSWGLAEVQLELGSVCTAIERRPLADDVDSCLRYYEKSYDELTAPGAVISSGCWVGYSSAGLAASTVGDVYYSSAPSFMARKRTTPSIQLWSVDGTLAALRYGGVSNRGGTTPIQATQLTPFQGLHFDATSATAMAAGVTSFIHWTASAEL